MLSHAVCIIMQMMGSTLFKSLLPSLQETIQQNVRIAIAEDIGSGDLTAQLIPSDKTARATIICRESAVICGIPWAEACFEQIVPDSITIWKVSEGDTVAPNQTLCEISGNARALLTAERSALNFLQAMSSTATVTRQFVDAVAGTSARIMDTRKTIPGMRLAQKYAVTVGGGLNQRMGLYDGILIKENHIATAGSIDAVLKSAHDINSKVSIQIEVETLAQLATAIDAGAKLILLDNFSPELLCKAVKLNAKRAILEASGGISLDNVREIALTGVDRISIGSLTKNIQAVDLSMRFAE